VIGNIIPEPVIDPGSVQAAFIESVTTVDMKDFLCDNYKITFTASNYRTDD
jgi:hypothetical protein